MGRQYELAAAETDHYNERSVINWLNLICAADWCDRQCVPYTIQRDDETGWFIAMQFTDKAGPYSAYMDLPVRSTEHIKRIKDNEEKLRGTIDRALARACADAHGKRCGQSLRVAK